jgi:murein DD-endopeptidase MepM/ murein hydrolase activator NlpD
MRRSPLQSMLNSRLWVRWLGRIVWLLPVLLSGCIPAAASSLPSATFSEALPSAAGTWTAVPAIRAVAPSLITPTLPPTATQLPTPTLQPTPMSTSCAPDLCVFSGVFPFSRPIALPGTDTVEISYRFGSTANGTRDPHHGIEFLNAYGTPVLAAGDGDVVVAGDDRKVFYGPYSYFYGNLVVLEHHLPGYKLPVFTLYGHLSKVLVQVGQQVKSGQQVGLVGMSGVATGPHLHFEVRYGENTYASSRNPELWLQPHQDENGVPNGALAGRILDAQGDPIAVKDIVVERQADQTPSLFYRAFVGTYEEKGLLSQPPWNEDFGLGDLPPGQYKISFVQYGFQQYHVQVLPGRLTLVTFQLGTSQP